MAVERLSKFSFQNAKNTDHKKHHSLNQTRNTLEELVEPSGDLNFEVRGGVTKLPPFKLSELVLVLSLTKVPLSGTVPTIFFCGAWPESSERGRKRFVQEDRTVEYSKKVKGIYTSFTNLQLHLFLLWILYFFELTPGSNEVPAFVVGVLLQHFLHLYLCL